MTRRAPRALIQTAWLAVGIIAAVLLVDTARFIQSAGLFGDRPPLPAAQTALRLVIMVAAVASLTVFRRPIERLTALLGIAAAVSAALYGFGLRSPVLSAFRVLAHLALWAFALACAATALYANSKRAGASGIAVPLEP